VAGCPLCRARGGKGMVADLLTVLGIPPQSCTWCQTTAVQERSRGWSVNSSLPPMRAPQGESSEDRIWSLVSAALEWNPTMRHSVQQLLRRGPWPKTAATALVPEPTPLPPPPPPPLPAPPLLPSPNRRAESAASARACQEWLRSSAQGLKRETVESHKPCVCAGHCGQPGHKYHKGCSSRRLVAGTRWCELCLRVVCPSPRGRGDLCHRDRKSLKKLAAPLRIARASRSCAHELIPDDVTIVWTCIRKWCTTCRCFSCLPS